ncbi:MAG: DUF4349 domain-containing protein, partial [Lachnospiraceae bacterium]|nr:DUF4349 domain-containing protein [Lachnospiraceae bacterium]
MKKWKGAAALLLAVVLAGSMSACGSKGLSSNAVAEDSYVDTGWGMPASEEVAEAAALSEEAPAESKVSVDASLSEADQTAAQDKDQKAAKRKLIRNVNMSIETTEFDELLVLIEQKVTELGGYIESSSVDGTPDSNRRNSYLSVRVPADQLEAFETMLGNSATVLSKSSSVEDVTLRYSDLAAHIESLRIEQETLMEMLSKAEDVDTVLIIQNELTNIRYQLESYESQMKVMDNQIDYSTVSINIREVKVPTAQEQEGFFSRLKKTFTNSIRNLGTDIEDFLIFFLGNIVGIVLFIAIAIGVLFLIR